MRKERGITLISLVVTIIVLIILAGISINLILGQDGIINKAKEAKQNMELAQIEEQEQLNILYDQMIGESDGLDTSNSIQKLIDFKKALADYIEGKNVERPESAGDASVYINSFEEVLALASKVDENEAATSEDIAEGKKAWVNGELITGNNLDTSTNSKAPTVLYYVAKNKSTSYSYPSTNYTVTSISGSDITVDGYSFKFNRSGTVYLDCRCLYSSSSGSESGVNSYIQILKNDEVVEEFSNTYTNPDTHNIFSIIVNANDVISFKGKCNVAFWWTNKVIIAF